MGSVTPTIDSWAGGEIGGNEQQPPKESGGHERLKRFRQSPPYCSHLHLLWGNGGVQNCNLMFCPHGHLQPLDLPVLGVGIQPAAVY
jgi:hypothetical protein